MRGVTYTLGETIQDKDELSRLEWLMKNSRDSEIREKANGLVGEYYGIQQQNKDRQWELLHWHRAFFIRDIKATLKLFIECGQKSNNRFGQKLEAYFLDQQGGYRPEYANGRYLLEIWTIILLLAGKTIDEEGVSYKLDRNVMEQFIEQGKQENWFETAKNEVKNERNAILKEQNIILQPRSRE